jgi:tRNA pseudouridine32 synthase/23S rRNA pseudouridine746 synthase
VIAREDGKTRIHFFPVTGRTHQLRVHAAHPKGLNAPILGDELYGNPAERLYLHAECLEFTHPISGKQMIIEAKADF